MTTFEQERTEAQKTIDADVLARVQRGLAWLEETHGPGWEDHIDMDALELCDSRCCVLGQLYGAAGRKVGWSDGFSYATDRFEDLDVAAFGFDKDEPSEEWDDLQAAWVHVLTPRVGK